MMVRAVHGPWGEPALSMSNPEIISQTEILVRVWGMDADGHAFFQNTMAGGLTASGARLTGLEHPLQNGEIIGLQYDGKKTRVRVTQLGDAVLPGKIQAQVEIVGGQPCPWADLASREGQLPEKIQPAGGDSNKRRFPRLRTHFPFELRDERGSSSAMKTHAADISGRGCYVETLVPLPLGTPLSITLRIDEDKIVTTAMVRSSDPGVGLRFEFSGFNESTKERLQAHLEKLAAESAAKLAAAKETATAAPAAPAPAAAATAEKEFVIEDTAGDTAAKEQSA